MKKLLSQFFILGLILAACGTEQTQSAPPVQTFTPSLVSTATQTPIPPTPTVTPLPTIPTFTSTQKMYDGCAAAIQYAVEHPEILTPLGSDYHGWQSHIYRPADVCPFR